MADLSLRFLCQCPGGVERAELQGDRIVGRFSLEPRLVKPSGPGVLARDFLNLAPTPANILGFTKRCGPLRPEWSSGAEFEFDLHYWRWAQDSQRYILGRIGDAKARGVGTKALDTLVFVDGKAIVEAANLGSLIAIDMFSCYPERLRFCALATPDLKCEKVFLSRDRRKRYCSKECFDAHERHRKLLLWGHKKDVYRPKKTTVRTGGGRRGSHKKG